MVTNPRRVCLQVVAFVHVPFSFFGLLKRVTAILMPPNAQRPTRAAARSASRPSEAHAGQTQFRLVTEFCGKEISVLRPPRCN